MCSGVSPCTSKQKGEPVNLWDAFFLWELCVERYVGGVGGGGGVRPDNAASAGLPDLCTVFLC